MKHIGKSLLSLFLIAILLLSAVGCSGGIDKDRAKADMQSFLDAVAAEDYEAAAALMHPARPLDLKAFFEHIEAEEGVDFGSGIEVLRSSGFSYAYYDSEIDGSRYALELEVEIGGVRAEIELEAVQNDAGYGIYDVEVDV